MRIPGVRRKQSRLAEVGEGRKRGVTELPSIFPLNIGYIIPRCVKGYNEPLFSWPFVVELFIYLFECTGLVRGFYSFTSVFGDFFSFFLYVLLVFVDFFSVLLRSFGSPGSGKIPDPDPDPLSTKTPLVILIFSLYKIV